MILFLGLALMHVDRNWIKIGQERNSGSMQRLEHILFMTYPLQNWQERILKEHYSRHHWKMERKKSFCLKQEIEEIRRINNNWNSRSFGLPKGGSNSELVTLGFGTAWKHQHQITVKVDCIVKFLWVVASMQNKKQAERPACWLSRGPFLPLIDSKIPLPRDT